MFLQPQVVIMFLNVGWKKYIANKGVLLQIQGQTRSRHRYHTEYFMWFGIAIIIIRPTPQGCWIQGITRNNLRGYAESVSQVCAFCILVYCWSKILQHITYLLYKTLWLGFRHFSKPIEFKKLVFTFFSDVIQFFFCFFISLLMRAPSRSRLRSVLWRTRDHFWKSDGSFLISDRL